MISLRQHIASLIAIFLALAVGIALGGGPFAHGDDDDTKSSTTTTPATTSGGPSTAAATDAEAIRQAEFAQKFDEQGAVRIDATGLTGHAVCVLALPGADATQIKAINGQVIEAGGSLSGTFTVGQGLV